MDFRRALPLALAALVTTFLTACVTDDGAGKRVNPTIPEATSNAQLRSGDSLTIALQGVPDPSLNAVQIDDEGSISLPYIGTLAAAGANTGELAQRIRDTYIAKKIYNTVDVSVSVTERFVYVGGEVVRPGRIIWTPDLTVTKAIQSAGGFTLYAKETRVSLTREQNTYEIDTKLAQKNPAQDPRLVPGDAIQIPRSPF
jgi:polysaccharide export outer membrane protein